MNKLTTIQRVSLSLCALSVWMGNGTPIQAKSFQNETEWAVVFSKQNTMENNFTTGQVDDLLYGMQPGDDATIEITIKNENKDATDWYLSNAVLRSLEDGSAASGGAYAYALVYTDPQGRTDTIYQSETLGGEAGQGMGLKDATDSLDEFFLVDTLKQGQAGTVSLQVVLDGETQGNSYQSTLADLQMEFAVEKNIPAQNQVTQGKPTTTILTGQTTKSPNTATWTSRLPWLLVSALSGAILFGLALVGIKENKEEKRHE